VTKGFSELLPRALDELEERWRARQYTALQVREFCAKLTSRMRSADAAHRPRVDALYAATDHDPAVIASEIDEIIENHEAGENYRDTLEESYNLLDRAAAVPKQHELLKRFVVKVVVEARGHAAKDPIIAEYLGAWLAPKTWRAAGVQIPGDVAGAKKPMTKPAKNLTATKSAASKPTASKGGTKPVTAAVAATKPAATAKGTATKGVAAKPVAAKPAAAKPAPAATKPVGKKPTSKKR
jgi:hypothetical protein